MSPRRQSRAVCTHDEVYSRGVTARPQIVLYGARDCELCTGAEEVLDRLARELGFDYRKVDIGGIAVLEAAYREHLPVVEIDGERAFTHYVPPQALRERLED